MILIYAFALAASVYCGMYAAFCIRKRALLPSVSACALALAPLAAAVICFFCAA